MVFLSSCPIILGNRMLLPKIVTVPWHQPGKDETRFRKAFCALWLQCRVHKTLQGERHC